MTTHQKTIATRLQCMAEMNNVKVVCAENLSDIYVFHSICPAANFHFKWVKDTHYAGEYSGTKRSSGTVMKLCSMMDTVKFIGMFRTLVDLFESAR